MNNPPPFVLFLIINLTLPLILVIITILNKPWHLKEKRAFRSFPKQKTIFSELNTIDKIGHIMISSSLFMSIATLLFLLLGYLPSGATLNFSIQTTAVVTMTVGVLTASLVLVSLDKQYYIVFSMREVMAKYNVKFMLETSVFTCIATCIFTTICPQDNILIKYDQNLETINVVFMILVITFSLYNTIVNLRILLFILLPLLFGPDIGLKLLLQLYEIVYYRRYRIDGINPEKIKEGDFDYNLDHLTKQYEESIKKIQWKKYDLIEYDTCMIDMGKKRKVFRLGIKNTLKIQLFVFILSIIIWLLIETTTKNYKGYQYCIIAEIIILIGTFLFLIILCVKLPSIFLNITFGNPWGFFLIKKKNTRKSDNISNNAESVKQFVNIMPNSRTKYSCFIRARNSLIGFFIIYCDRGGKDYKKIVKTLIKKLSILDDEDYKQARPFLFMPLVAIDYLFWNEKKTSSPVRNLYYTKIKEKSEDDQDDKEEIFTRMMRGELRMLNTENDTDLPENAEAFINWFCKKG